MAYGNIEYAMDRPPTLRARGGLPHGCALRTHMLTPPFVVAKFGPGAWHNITRPVTKAQPPSSAVPCSYMTQEHLKLQPDAAGGQPPPQQPPPGAHREAMLRCIEFLADYAEPPFVQLLAGDEGMYNPIPVLWLGGSPGGRRHLLGLCSGVVWT